MTAAEDPSDMDTEDCTYSTAAQGLQLQQQVQRSGSGLPNQAAEFSGRVYEPAPSRSKKGRSKVLAGNQRQQQELVHLVGPISTDKLQQMWSPVHLSEDEKAGEIELDEKKLQAKSTKGYRMARATHGTHQGTWYFEVHIEQLGKSGAARLGWSTARGELQAPVGYDTWSYAYRSREGSKVHAGWREEYGEAFEAGDVVGCLIHLPPGGQPLPTLRERSVEEAVQFRSKAYFAESEDEQKEPDPDAQPLEGSFVAFTRNGRMQGKAYSDIKEGTYYPALSLYTDATLLEEAVVKCNFGETPFAHPPPQVEGCPQARAMFEVAGPKPDTSKSKDQA